ncbi:MAG: hypothetical protein KGM16_13845 [Bacteroidota bacterium]|nr:hypothetical protein [Bacteroidota bacterium]
MSNYYLLGWKHRSELASAIYDLENQLAQELIPQLEGKYTLPHHFQLKMVKETEGGLVTDNILTTMHETWMDYQPNSLSFPLMSERLKSVIESHLTGNENVDWISCKVKMGNEERPYFILRFNKILDVLNTQKTTFVPGTDQIIKPVFAESKVSAYNIFTKPSSHGLWKITPNLYVSEVLKKAIKKQDLTGIDFERTMVI